jgi:hypothetical protein
VRGFRGKKSSSGEKIRSGALTSCRNLGGATTRASRRKAGRAGRGEGVEYELDAFISKRHEQRVKSEGERQLEEAWRESKRREKLRQREENRGGWLSWYRRLERGYLERAAECGRRADALEIDRATQPKGAT